jgi:hypothetical protein
VLFVRVSVVGGIDENSFIDILIIFVYKFRCVSEFLHI